MMKKLIALFLALCLLCSLAGCSKQSVRQRDEDDSSGSTARPELPRASSVPEPEEEEPEKDPEEEPEEEDVPGPAVDFLGSWDGNVYSNEFLGLSYTLPDDWVRASDEELLKMLDVAVSNELLSDKTRLSIELAKSIMVYGMVAQDPINGSSVQVMFMNLEGFDGISEEECAKQMAAQQETLLDESSGITLSIGDTYRAPLGGKSFLVLPVEMSISDVAVEERIYIQISGEYGMIVAITARADQNIETMGGGVSAFGPLGSTSGSTGTSGVLTATGDIGRTFDTMFFDYTVVSAESPSEYYGHTAQSGNKLLVLGVKVKNDFGSTLPMYDTDFQIQWGPGDQDYAWAVDAFNNRMMPLEWEIEDGDEITWDMLFEVPANQYDFSLVYLEEYTDRFGNDQTGDFYSADFTLPVSNAA